MAKKRAKKKPTSAGQQIDANLVSAGLRKLQAGQPPTKREEEAMRRREKALEEERRQRYYRSIPQKHWKEMSGRQAGQLKEQAERYGIPFGGKTVDLPEVVRKWHDFLAANKIKLAKVEGDDELLLGPGSSPWLEELRKETAKIKRMDRLERERELLPRGVVHEGLTRMSTILRNFGETLERHYGPAAKQLLNDVLDDYQRESHALYDR